MPVRHRRVFMVGETLVMTVPVDAPFNIGDEIYAYTDGCALIYSRTPPRFARLLYIVRVRRMGRCRGSRCYKAVTIPREIARSLGIENGSYMEVRVEGEKLIAVKPGGCSEGAHA